MLLEQLALARDVAAVALGSHVFAHGADVFARDDLIADACLDRDLKKLPRHDLLHRFDEVAPLGFGL